MGYVPLTDIQLKTLEYVHGCPEQTADMSEVETHLGSDPLNVLDDLADKGFLKRALRGDGVYHLASNGHAEVEALLARRNDRRHRRPKSREALLVWLDNNTRPDDAGTRKSLSKFTGEVEVDGKAFTQEETNLAARHLLENGLIKSLGAGYDGEPLMAYITERGVEHLDGGGSFAPQVGPPDASLQAGGNASQNVTITGSGNIVITMAGDNNQVTASINDFDLEKARAQSEAIRQALPALENLQDELVPLLDQIQADDRSPAQKATFAVYKLLTNTGVGALGGALALPLAQALGFA